jgi:hypothetical protein
MTGGRGGKRRRAGRGRLASPVCTCRTCIARSLGRALLRLDRGQIEIAGRIILFATIDLTRDAVFVTTGPGTKAPLCENDRRHAIAKQLRDAGVELEERE